LPKFDDIHKSDVFGKTDVPDHEFHSAESSAVDGDPPTSFEHDSGKTCFGESPSVGRRFPPETAIHPPIPSIVSMSFHSGVETFFYLSVLYRQFSDHLLIFGDPGLDQLSFLLDRRFPGQSFQAALNKCISPTVIQGLADVVPPAQFRDRDVPFKPARTIFIFTSGVHLRRFISGSSLSMIHQ
jgi:hypothetical protein